MSDKEGLAAAETLPHGDKLDEQTGEEPERPTLDRSSENGTASAGPSVEEAVAAERSAAAEKPAEPDDQPEAKKNQEAQDGPKYKEPPAQHTEPKPLGKAQNKRRQKKDPNAPHRPLSAYNLFFRDTRKKLKPTPDVKISFEALVKTVSARWKEASPEEKAKYEELAKEDNVRYYTELKAYHERGDVQSAMAKSNRKRRKILGVAKRPLSGYNIFFSEEHARIKQQLSEGKIEPFANVTVEIARRWADLSAQDKAVLQQRAEDHRKTQQAKEQDEKGMYGPNIGLMQSIAGQPLGLNPGLAGRFLQGMPGASTMQEAIKNQLLALSMGSPIPGQSPFGTVPNPFFPLAPPATAAGFNIIRAGGAVGPQSSTPLPSDFAGGRPYMMDPRMLSGFGDQDLFNDPRLGHELLQAMAVQAGQDQRPDALQQPDFASGISAQDPSAQDEATTATAALHHGFAGGRFPVTPVDDAQGQVQQDQAMPPMDLHSQMLSGHVVHGGSQAPLLGDSQTSGQHSSREDNNIDGASLGENSVGTPSSAGATAAATLAAHQSGQHSSLQNHSLQSLQSHHHQHSQQLLQLMQAQVPGAALHGVSQAPMPGVMGMSAKYHQQLNDRMFMRGPANDVLPPQSSMFGDPTQHFRGMPALPMGLDPFLGARMGPGGHPDSFAMHVSDLGADTPNEYDAAGRKDHQHQQHQSGWKEPPTFHHEA